MALPLGLQSVHDERRLLKWIFGVGIALITLFLAITNVTGAWVETKSWAFSGLALGAEIALVAAFSLIILGETRWRQAVGAVVFCGLAWFCVENGKAAVKHWMSDVFVGSPAELKARAELMNAEAGKLDALPTDTKAEAAETRAADREELAALRVEQKQMQAQDELGIKVAQTALKTRGDYLGPIDGIREDLTEAAMAKRGAEISARIAILQAKLDGGGTQTDAVAALAPAQTARLEAIKLTEQASEVSEREVWAQILLLVAEAARSFGVWAFLMAGTRESARYGRRAEDKVEDAPDAPPEQEREAPADQSPQGDQEETETPTTQEEPAVEPLQADPVDEAIDAATGTEPRPKPRVGDPEKGADSTNFNRETGKVDDSLPIDEPGVADGKVAA
jgi:hypothetical protein